MWNGHFGLIQSKNGENTLIQANTQALPVALVTGGARRIGAAIVKTLHDKGYRVVIHCRQSIADARALADALNQIRPQSAHVVVKELREADAPSKLVQDVKQWAGRLDVLVNNASLFKKTTLNVFSGDDWQALFDIHVKVPWLLSQAFQPLLADSEGVIINITDIHAQSPLKDYAEYCQSKAALEMQTKALAKEFAPKIRVNAVAPGAIAWPENENTISSEVQQKIIQQTPLQRHGAPEYIAEAVLALVNNTFITGQILNVDGGRSL